MKKFQVSLVALMLALAAGNTDWVQAQIVPAVPDAAEVYRAFGDYDRDAFASPSKIYYPETWFHYIGGNVAKEGITADLEAIAGAGISGIHLFHGQFGGAWPGVTNQIPCLSESWEDLVQFTAKECDRLGLRLTMQNCPGWAMSGGPWIAPENAMRHLVWSRTDLTGNEEVLKQGLVKPSGSAEDWRDYRDITVLAFPTPLDDTGASLTPESVKTSEQIDWAELLTFKKNDVHFPGTSADKPHTAEVHFANPVQIRTLEFPSVNSLRHARCYIPNTAVKLEAILEDGSAVTVLDTQVPQASWQDDRPVTFACSDAPQATQNYRITVINQADFTMHPVRLYTAARKNNWESEAGWTLRSIDRGAAHPTQNPAAYIDANTILDISGCMDAEGNLTWKAPAGKWTILRIGHVNTGMRNGPAPAEGTGWECDKLSTKGPAVHFAGYIGKLNSGALKGGLLKGMLMDSWECKTQTWTDGMEEAFAKSANYELRKWLPAVFGYVIGNQETTSKFLYDWRKNIGEMFAGNFYGEMARLAKENGLSITYETAAGDIFPADIMEYYKYADVPMCEFWQPLMEDYVGSLNFKPIKPTASAARIYGKSRVAAESFTSFNLTWDEHWSMLKEVANVNCVEGVNHFVFHTYTHNPRTDFLPPGTAFGSGIGTPFLRGQTWWKQMPAFTGYLARCNYMLERGLPVSDVLWYLGDEINHKPNQEIPFPAGYKYDYCNPDVLMNRLSVKDGQLCTPEGIRYNVLWIPDTTRMQAATLEKLYVLIAQGAKVIANPPQGSVTLSGGEKMQKRFEKIRSLLWDMTGNIKIREIGNGKLLSDIPLMESLKELSLSPDVTGGDALWVHRRTEGADWYYVTAPKGKGFKGTLNFHKLGKVEVWDPLTGKAKPVACRVNGEYTSVDFDLPQSGCCFVMFTAGKPLQLADAKPITTVKELSGSWTLNFPEGWGITEPVTIDKLVPWKDLDLSAEGKAFSGTVTYTTKFDAGELDANSEYLLDMEQVEFIAEVTLNGKKLGTLWTPPYRISLADAIQSGENSLTIDVTGTWFNRLVFDAGQPENARKTWTISGPSKDAGLRNSGLIGKITLLKQ